MRYTSSRHNIAFKCLQLFCKIIRIQEHISIMITIHPTSIHILSLLSNILIASMPFQWIIDIEFPRLTFLDPFSLGHFFLIWYIVILSSFTLTNTMKLYILSILCIWIWFEFIDLSKSFEIRFKLSIRILIIWFIFRSSKHDEYETINVRSIQLNLKE